MPLEPTTIDQQLEFITDMRESFDNEGRQRIALQRTPEQTAQLLKDIHQNLIGVRNWQHGQEVTLCTKCNKPILDVALVNENYKWQRRICVQCGDQELEKCKAILEAPKSYICPECGYEVSADGFDHGQPVMCTKGELPVQMEAIYL